MVRHLVRIASSILTLLVCLSALTDRVEAQALSPLGGGNLSDPFSFYYAVYLPNQQLQALRPGPLDAVDNAMVARQYYAQTQRRSLYNPISPYADTYDPLHPYSQQGQERAARPFRFAHDPSNADGNGPSLYYNRAAQYFPDLAARQGRRPNANVARYSPVESTWWHGRRHGHGRNGRRHGWRHGWRHGYGRHVLIDKQFPGPRVTFIPTLWSGRMAPVGPGDCSGLPREQCVEGL